MSDITSLVELTRGAALVIDYGEDHAFSNSFRGIKDHKLVKDWPSIFHNIGTLDLTAYVNFKQLSAVAKQNKNAQVMGPMPQGQFLESMGIRVRLEALGQKEQNADKRQLL